MLSLNAIYHLGVDDESECEQDTQAYYGQIYI